MRPTAPTVSAPSRHPMAWCWRKLSSPSSEPAASTSGNSGGWKAVGAPAGAPVPGGLVNPRPSAIRLATP